VSARAKSSIVGLDCTALKILFGSNNSSKDTVPLDSADSNRLIGLIVILAILPAPECLVDSLGGTDEPKSSNGFYGFTIAYRFRSRIPIPVLLQEE
jgi:hypothetical protein